jgi:hypothetical protein
MTNLIDRSYFQELEESDPETVCRRALCEYDNDSNAYMLSVWGEDYLVNPSRLIIKRLGRRSADIDDLLGLFIIYYLLKCKNVEVENDWISEKDMPGGVTFFRGPHAIPTELISNKYSGMIDEFTQRCQLLNGHSLDMADSAGSFSITPRIPVAVLLWDRDDEFSAEAKILFDRTITEHLTLDIIYSLAVVVCQRIAGNHTE